MAVVALSNSPHHYIRTIHTSFTAAHPAWSRSHAHSNNHQHTNSNATLNVNLNVSVSPLLSSNHANLPLYSTAPKHHQAYVQHSHIQGQGLQNYNSKNGNIGGNGNGAPAHQHQGAGAGGRRRAYAFRAPHPVPRHPQRQQTHPLVPQQTATQTTGKTTYKFDPFADEPQPQTQSPSLSTLASLSVPPTPRLASATLPPRRAPAPAPAATTSLPSRTSPPPVGSRTPSPPHSRSPPPVTSCTPSPPAQRQFNYHLQQQQRNIWAAPAPSPSPAHSFNNNPSAPRSFTPAPYHAHAHARSASTPPLAHRQSYYASRSVSPPQSQPQNQTRFEVEVYDDSTSAPPSALSTRPSTPVDAAEKAAKDLEKARAAKEARARIVAGILLNRAWALGKGTRRRGGVAARGLGAYGRCGVNGAGNGVGVGAAAGCGKGASGYVPSGLSRVVCAGEL